MTRALRWILLVVILGGAAYLVVAVDFGGTTLLDRMLGRTASPEPQKAPPPEAPATGSDGLTEEDRQGLNRLIESKTKEDKEGEASP